MKSVLVFVFICTIGFMSCGSDDPTDIIPEFLQRYNITADQTASGLYFSIENPGGVVEINDDSFVVFQITQYDLENNIIGGTNNGNFPVALAVNTVLPGLREGLQLINEGGRITLYIPPDLSGGAISSGALIYGIEVVDVYADVFNYNESVIDAFLTERELVAEVSSEGLYYIISEPGEDPKPTNTSDVTVDYHGYFLNDIVFDSSVDRGTPSSFNLSEVIEGWQLGIPLFGTGGKGMLVIPSYLAYGEQGNTGIPANYPIAFDIELISFD